MAVQECLTIRRTGMRKGFHYYALALYRAHTTKDGRRVWRFVQDLSAPSRSQQPAFHGVAGDPRYKSGVRQNDPAPEETGVRR